jgi:hypothetical protein
MCDRRELRGHAHPRANAPQGPVTNLEFAATPTTASGLLGQEKWKDMLYAINSAEADSLERPETTVLERKVTPFLIRGQKAGRLHPYSGRISYLKFAAFLLLDLSSRCCEGHATPYQLVPIIDDSIFENRNLMANVSYA